MKDIKVYEVLFDNIENEDLGIQAVSMVESPAIQSGFIALSEQKPYEVKLADEDKRLLVGAALIPNKPIFREMNGEEFYIIFSKDTIRRASQLYLKRSKQNNTTHEHSEPVADIFAVESWIVEDPKMDKAALYGFDVPIGTWMLSMKVDNEDYWLNEVKTGNVKGFSIEGVFAPEMRADLKKQPIDNYDAKLEEVKKLLKMI